VLFVLTLGLASLGAGPAQFRGGVNVVELNVSVRAGKNAVLDLEPADFQVLDNQVEQRVMSVSRDVLPIDLTVAIDMSETQGRYLVPPIERAIGQVRGHLKRADRVSILTFGDRLRMLAVRVTPDAASGIKLGTPSGWGTRTPLNDALAVVFAAPAEPDRRQVAIVFADGGDTGSFLTQDDVLDLAARSRFAVFTLTRVASSWGAASFPRAIVDHPERRPAAFFARLTALTGGQVRAVEGSLVEHPKPGLLTVRLNPDLVDNAFTSAIDDFRSGYVVRYALTGTPAAGSHDVAVKIRGHEDYLVRTRTGYQGG
jgi:hypothetical protein